MVGKICGKGRFISLELRSVMDADSGDDLTNAKGH